ncbi:unnamed protein product [Arctogadus glacialis]
MADVFSVQLRTYVRRYVRALYGRTDTVPTVLGSNVQNSSELREASGRSPRVQMFLVFHIWAESGPDVPSVPHLGRVRSRCSTSGPGQAPSPPSAPPDPPRPQLPLNILERLQPQNAVCTAPGNQRFEERSGRWSRMSDTLQDV